MLPVRRKTQAGDLTFYFLRFTGLNALEYLYPLARGQRYNCFLPATALAAQAGALAPKLAVHVHGIHRQHSDVGKRLLDGCLDLDLVGFGRYLECVATLLHEVRI